MPKSPLRLLLVEDHPDQRELILDIFAEKGPAIQIAAAENGPSSLELLDRERFDAVILDYSLPFMSGLEVLSRIQEREYTVPVIMVTGQGDEKIAVEAMKRGAYDYIMKTVNYQVTLPTVVLKAIEKHQLKKHLDESTRRARRLYETSLSVTTKRKVDALADALVTGARELIQTGGSILLLARDDGPEIDLVRSSGIDLSKSARLSSITSTGLLGMAYAERRPVAIESSREHPKWEETPADLRSFLDQFLAVPLLRQEKAEGVLAVLNKEDGEPFSREDIDALSTLSLYAAVAIDNARFSEEAERQAVTDSLTGLFNHREFQKRLAGEAERGSRYGKEFTLLMLDIDHFKSFNDTHGHPAGDAILREIVGVIRRSIRSVDVPARYGGEEFAVILPETDGEKGRTLAERIRQSIAEGLFVTPSGHPAHLSVSVGIASFPLDATKRDELIIAADEALYFAKEAGRNRVCRYSDTLKSAIEKDKEKLAAILQNPQMKTIRDLAATIDAKSPYTRGHTEGVVQYAVLLADALNLTPEEKKNLQIASLLHNIGMVGIPDTLLNKSGPLSGEELKIIQAHPGLAEMLIKGSAQLESVLPAILYHHERYDGHGYPNGLRGEGIPFLARVLGVVEAYDAMTSVRPYRPKMTRQEAVDELARNAGSQFDPRVVDAFVRLLNDANGSDRDAGSEG